MLTEGKTNLSHTTSIFSEFIHDWANAFYQAKKVEGVSPYTLIFYKQQLEHFLKFCHGQVIDNFSQLSPTIIREYLLWLEEGGHNPGGQHAAYRVLKTFLRWYENEVEPENWHNPISKVKAPKLAEEPLSPVALADVQAMVKSCKSGIFLDVRDKAMLLVLLDTGARAREFTALDLADLDFITGALTIRKGKGRKPRTVFLGEKSRRAIRAYLKSRKDICSALWVIDDDAGRLGYPGLRKMLVRRAKLAGVDTPSPHDFRRAFAINMLRAGVDLVTLARLMGHTNLKTLQRYLLQLPEDLQAAHNKGSPVDRAFRF